MEINKLDLKEKLSPLEYHVTQECGTQPAYENQYYKTTTSGVYNCKICQTQLFSSDSKFDSGSGWPAFNKQIKNQNIKKIVDKSHGLPKIQVRCSKCDSHLGHYFQRESQGTKNKSVRYCINSASLILKKQQQK